jgi:hypothetical protein
MTTSDFTPSIDSGVGYDYLGWTQAIANQIANFTQNQSYSQGQEQFEQQKEQNSYTSDIRNVGAPILHAKTITESESQNIETTLAGWVDNGSYNSCGSWSPDVSTIDAGTLFNQTASCKQPQNRNISYKLDGTQIATSIGNQIIDTTETKQATGTKYVPASIQIGGCGYNAVLAGNCGFSGMTYKGIHYGVGRGINILAIDSTNYNVISSAKYDTYGLASKSEEMATYLNALPNGTIIVTASYDSTEANMTTNGINALNNNVRYSDYYVNQHRSSVVAVAKKGTATNAFHNQAVGDTIVIYYNLDLKTKF